MNREEVDEKTKGKLNKKRENFEEIRGCAATRSIHILIPIPVT
jgi:hypothetical protein